MYPLLQPIFAKLLKCVWHQGWKRTHRQPSIIHRISLGSLAHRACSTNISEVSIRTKTLGAKKGLLQSMVCKPHSELEQGARDKVWSRWGRASQADAQVRESTEVDRQVYPAGEGPRWALPMWKSEGFILRMRRATEGSTPRTEETAQHWRKSTRYRVQTGPKRGKRESRETHQQAAGADQEGASDDLKSETRTGNEKDESTWEAVGAEKSRCGDWGSRRVRERQGSRRQRSWVYDGGLLFTDTVNRAMGVLTKVWRWVGFGQGTLGTPRTWLAPQVCSIAVTWAGDLVHKDGRREGSIPLGGWPNLPRALKTPKCSNRWT